MPIEDAPVRAKRPAARILLVDRSGGEQGGRVLLFRFTPDDRPPFWVTPGGAVDPGETHAEAARRELFEEVGLDRECGPEVAQRLVEFLTIERIEVTADERYYRIDLDGCTVDPARHTEVERRLMREWRWFTRDDIAAEREPIFPVDLLRMLADTDPLPEESACPT